MDYRNLEGFHDFLLHENSALHWFQSLSIHTNKRKVEDKSYTCLISCFFQRESLLYKEEEMSGLKLKIESLQASLEFKSEIEK